MPEPPAAPHDGERPRRAPPGDERTEPAAPGGVLGRWQQGWGWGGGRNIRNWDVGLGRGGGRGAAPCGSMRRGRSGQRCGPGGVPMPPPFMPGGSVLGPAQRCAHRSLHPVRGSARLCVTPPVPPPPPGQTACKAPCLCGKTAATPPALGQLCPLLAICPPHPREGPFAPPPARSLPPPPDLSRAGWGRGLRDEGFVTGSPRWVTPSG